MISVDRSALIAILRHEAEADAFLEVIANSDRCLISSVIHQETSMVLAGQDGGEKAWIRLDGLIAGAEMEIIPHDIVLAMAARRAFLRYGKGRHPAALDLCDCAAYALAQTRKVPLLFKGNDFVHTDVLIASLRN